MSDTDATQARQDVVADVDEILEHIINANMLSMPYDVYSGLFDAVDGLGVEIENLQAENAKLHTQLADVTESVGRMEERCAKLQELVRAMYYCHLPWKDCDKCAMNGADMRVEIDEMEFCDGINDRLRELGVVE